MPTLEFNKTDGLIWTPIYTLPRNEKKVYQLCCSRGFASYLPLKKFTKVHPVHSKGRSYAYKREQWLPMFPGYLFVQASPELKQELYQSRSVIRCLDTSGPLQDVLIRELELLQKLQEFSEQSEIDIADSLAVGQRVRLIDGDFTGWEGYVLHKPGKNRMVALNITAIQASVEIQYPADWCEKLDA